MKEEVILFSTNTHTVLWDHQPMRATTFLPAWLPNMFPRVQHLLHRLRLVLETAIMNNDLRTLML